MKKNKINVFKNVLFFSFLILVFQFCTKPKEQVSDTVSNEVNELPADTVVSISMVNGQPYPVTSKVPVYYSLENNAAISLSDSLTDKWDIGFKTSSRGESLLFTNSKYSGGGFVYKKEYSMVTEVPLDSVFVLDTKPGSAFGANWYTYNPQSHSVSPTPGLTLMIKGPKGNYAKIEMLSFYKGKAVPTTQNELFTKAYFYSFRYIYQKNSALKTFN